MSVNRLLKSFLEVEDLLLCDCNNFLETFSLFPNLLIEVDNSSFINLINPLLFQVFN